MKSLQAMIVAGIWLTAALSFGNNHAAQHAVEQSRPYQVIVHQVGDIDGFGFGLDVCPLGCELPAEPNGSGDPTPFDAPDSPCALTRTWTHDITADVPAGAQIVSAVLMVNAAGIQPDIFPSLITTDSSVFPLAYVNQGELGSSPLPVPLTPEDLADGVLQVTIKKGTAVGHRTICDQQFYDAAALVVLIRIP